MTNPEIDEDGLNEGNQSPLPEYASFWSRAAASMIDTLVFIPVITLSQYNIYTIKSWSLELLLVAALLIYKPFLEYRYGATIGKMFMKLKVVNESFEAISIDQSVKRFVLYLVSYMGATLISFWVFNHPDFSEVSDIVALQKIQKSLNAEFVTNVANIPILVSIIAVIFDSKKQALHDQFAGTYCIYNR